MTANRKGPPLASGAACSVECPSYGSFDSGFAVGNRTKNDEASQMVRGACQLMNSLQSPRNHRSPRLGAKMPDNFGQSRTMNSRRQVTRFIELRPHFHG